MAYLIRAALVARLKPFSTYSFPILDLLLVPCRSWPQVQTLTVQTSRCLGQQTKLQRRKRQHDISHFIGTHFRALAARKILLSQMLVQLSARPLELTRRFYDWRRRAVFVAGGGGGGSADSA